MLRHHFEQLLFRQHPQLDQRAIQPQALGLLQRLGFIVLLRRQQTFIQQNFGNTHSPNAGCARYRPAPIDRTPIIPAFPTLSERENPFTITPIGPPTSPRNSIKPLPFHHLKQKLEFRRGFDPSPLFPPNGSLQDEREFKWFDRSVSRGQKEEARENQKRISLFLRRDCFRLIGLSLR